MEAFEKILHLSTTGPVWDEGIEILSATPQFIQLVARCDRKTADRLIQFIHEIADLPMKERDAVGMAFREMLMNAIEHGAHFKATQRVAISYIRAKHMVLCRVKDPGEGFSLEDLDHCGDHEPAVQSNPTSGCPRKAGASTWRLWHPGHAKHHRRVDLRRKGQRGRAHQIPEAGSTGNVNRLA